jgi:hypothetical protein
LAFQCFTTGLEQHVQTSPRPGIIQIKNEFTGDQGRVLIADISPKEHGMVQLAEDAEWSAGM